MKAVRESESKGLFKRVSLIIDTDDGQSLTIDPFSVIAIPFQFGTDKSFDFTQTSGLICVLSASGKFSAATFPQWLAWTTGTFILNQLRM